MRTTLKSTLQFLVSLIILAVGSAMLYSFFVGCYFVVFHYVFSVGHWPSIIFSMLTGCATMWFLEDSFSLFSRFQGKHRVAKGGKE